MTPDKQYGAMLCFAAVAILCVGVLGHWRLPLGGCFFFFFNLHEAPKWLCGFRKDVTRASNEVGASSQWVKFRF